MIYVMSDIHGNERRFNSILEQIGLRREDTLYILGDAVDRHPQGVRILQRIMRMRNVKMLLGNHEYMMLRALGRPYDDNVDDGGAMAHWYRNGGEVTHIYWDRLGWRAQDEMIEFLRSLPLSYEVTVNGTRYKLAHGAPPEDYDGSERYRSPSYYAVWKRLDPDEELSGEHTLIFGHTPTAYFQDSAPMTVWYGQNRIGIDCGGGYPEDFGAPRNLLGRLACLRLDDGAVFYSEEDWKEA